MKKSTGHRRLALAASKKGYKVQIHKNASENNLRLVAPDGSMLATTLKINSSTHYDTASVVEAIRDIERLNSSFTAQPLQDKGGWATNVPEPNRQDLQAIANDAIHAIKQQLDPYGAGKINAVMNTSSGDPVSWFLKITCDVSLDGGTSYSQDYSMLTGVSHNSPVSPSYLGTDILVPKRAYGIDIDHIRTPEDPQKIIAEILKQVRAGIPILVNAVIEGITANKTPSPARKSTNKWWLAYYDEVSAEELADYIGADIEDFEEEADAISRARYGEVTGYLKAKPEYEDSLSEDGYEFLTIVDDSIPGISTGGSGLWGSGSDRSPLRFYPVDQETIETLIDAYV